ncbi:uncharacterized protein LOC124544937 [Schistocerca americana]|uniref:uncharacterized protein LOC124544937 n=1 Tax=Schistocerca americana TaxID=7009 RepID=UPI001F4F38C6|nr:uncharacterized protein LOC124544937 [Schistocerca americana]XP_047097737.1 uncharacterized protein LOC124711615 [Schistocerca piceifrons]
MLGKKRAAQAAAQWLLLLLLMLGASAARGRKEDRPTDEEVANLRRNMTDNSLLLFPGGDLPPLLCEMTKDSSERLSHPADFYALARVGFIMYCNFLADEADTSRLVRVNEIKLDKVFGWSDDDGHFGNYQPKRDLNSAACTLDSQMPAGFFDFLALRPHQQDTLRCYGNPAGETALLWFRGFPTVLCTMDAELELRGAYAFTLPGIAGEPFRCAFAPYTAVPMAEELASQERLHRSLTERYVPRGATKFPRYNCTEGGGAEGDGAGEGDPSGAAASGSPHFRAQSPSGVLYKCTFLL